MTGYESKRAAARDRMLDDDDTQVYQNHPAQEPVAWCSQCGHKCPLPAQEPVGEALKLAKNLLDRCETEMRYAGWTTLDTDNPQRQELYTKVQAWLKEKNT
jgi:hypothetical protein